MGSLKALLAAVAKVTEDYRRGDAGVDMTEGHVSRWIAQFPANVRGPILEELGHVFERSYISKGDVKKFLKALVTSEKLGGDDPKRFWKRCEFLNIQQGGASQTELLEVFDAALENAHDLALEECASETTFVYLDDAIFSGNRLKNDLTAWLQDAPKKSSVHVIVIAAYTGGVYYARKCIKEVSAKAGKSINLKVWRFRELENQRQEASNSDVLWPGLIPNDPLVLEYVEKLKAAGYPPTLRRGTSRGKAKLFSSSPGRALLEEELLKAGVLVRKRCKHLNEVLRPLGFTGLRTFGFGGMTVTYRNCPNTAPIALWAGEPWYPLFPRKTNTQTSTRWLDD